MSLITSDFISTTELKESPITPGKIEGQILVEFNAANPLPASPVLLSYDVPSGLTANLTRVSDTEAIIYFTGTAGAHTAAQTVNFSFDIIFAGDYVLNTTDGSQAPIVSAAGIDLTSIALKGGTDNTYTVGDSYQVKDFTGSTLHSGTSTQITPSSTALTDSGASFTGVEEADYYRSPSITLTFFDTPTPGDPTLDFEVYSACTCNTLVFEDLTRLYEFETNTGGYSATHTLNYDEIARATLGITFPGGNRYELDITEDMSKTPNLTKSIAITDLDSSFSSTSYFDAGKYTADLTVQGYSVAQSTTIEVAKTYSFYVWCRYYICMGKLLTEFENACCKDCQGELEARINRINTWLKIAQAMAECDDEDRFNKAKAKLDALCASDACGCNCS